MATVESIKASGGDYTTLAAWWAARGSAVTSDITADANAPYIAELYGETYEITATFTMSGVTTDATHYYHIRAASGYEFSGDISSPGTAYPLVKKTGVGGLATNVLINHTRLEGFGIQTAPNSGTSAASCLGASASNSKIDRMHLFGSLASTTNAAISGLGLNSSGSHVISNTVIGPVTTTVTGGSKSASAAGIDFVNSTGSFYLYNNTIFDISASNVDNNAIATGILSQPGTLAELEIVNCLIGDMNGDTNFCFPNFTATSLTIKNNATTDSTATTQGSDSYNNVTFLNEVQSSTDLHLKTGGSCEDNGLNLILNSYPNAPTADVDGEALPATGAWNIGVDYVVSAATAGSILVHPLRKFTPNLVR